MSQNQFPESTIIDEISHENERTITSSLTTSIGEMIRLNLPNIGNHLRRLIGLKSYHDVNGEPESSASANSSDTISPQGAISNLSSTSQTISIPSFNLSDYYASEIPSTSSYSTRDDDYDDDDYEDYDDDDDDDGASDLTISTFGTPGPLMISSGVNTSVHGLIARLVNDDGVIITGNPTDFVAALNVRMGRGIDGESELPFEPQRIPLFFSSSDNNRGYTINSVSIDSSSSLSGWSSSETDDVGTEIGETESYQQRQDEARQFYDNSIVPRQSVRKQFRHFDDEPPIY